MANSAGFQNRETVSKYCPLNFWPMSLSIFLLSLLQLSCLGYWEARYKRQLAHYWCISSVQLLSHVRFFATPWTAACQASLSITQAHVYWVGDAIQPSHPQSSPSPPAFNLSQCQGLFQWVSSPHQVPKYWSCSFNVNPSNEYSGLISFRMDWLDLLAVQGNLKSSPTPQFKSINSSALSFLHSPTLTSIHDHWKNYSLSQQSNVSAFEYAI